MVKQLSESDLFHPDSTMPLKFCLGAPNISAGYAVANVHLMISSFMIISLAGVVDALADPFSITILVLVLLFAIVQGLLIFGLWKRIRPILILWLVIESLTTLIVVGGLIAAAFIIEMIPGI